MEENNKKFKLANVITRALKPLKKYDRYLLWYSLCAFTEGETKVVVSKEKFMKDFGIEHGKMQEEMISKAMTDMISKTAVILDKDVSPTGNKVACSLIYWCEEQGDKIEIKRLPEVVELLDGIRNDYTWYYLDQLAKLDGTYSPKIYEFARMLLVRFNQHKVSWEWHIEPSHTNQYDSLKSWLDLVDLPAYKNFYEIERRILLPSIKEINDKCSDCHIFYDSSENKRGAKNKVKSIVLHISDSKPVEAESEVPIQQDYWYDSIPEAPSLTTATLRKIAQVIVDEMDSSWLFSNQLTATASEAERLRSSITKHNIRRGLLRFAILNYESVRSRGIVIKNKQQYIIGTIKKVFADLNDDYSNYNSTQAQEFLQKLGEANRLDQKNFMKKFGLKIEKK